MGGRSKHERRQIPRGSPAERGRGPSLKRGEHTDNTEPEVSRAFDRGIECIEENMRKQGYRRISLVFLIAAFIWVPLICMAQGNEKNQMNMSDLEQRGKELRAEIDQEFQKLKGSNKFEFRNDIVPLFEKYMPVGTSFDEAAVILRSAGFNIDPLPPYPVPEDPPPGYSNESRFMMSGDITLESNFYSKSEAIIVVRPESPGAVHNTIKELYGYILHTSL